MRDRFIIFAATFLRATAVGLAGVLIGLYLAQLNFSARLIGEIVAAGLGGGAVAALIATVAADRFGRRRFLLVLALISAAGGVAMTVTANAAILAFAAFAGMVNGMGKDRGAALVVEQAILPSTASDRDRTKTFAIYNVIQASGAAIGGLAAGIPGLLHRHAGLSEAEAMRTGIYLYAALMFATALLYPALTQQIESRERRAGFKVSPQSRNMLLRLSALFALDSVGSGFLTQALIALFFARRFGLGAGEIGLLFFCASVANALSQFIAAYLAGKIGLINTMVFTHIPANLLLIAVAFAPNFVIAAPLYILRELMVQMDVPTRQSYVMAVVAPEERTFASGVTNLVRLGGWAVAPSFAGMMMEGLSITAPLVVGPLLKVTYDLLLYASFRNLRPPEELAGAQADVKASRSRA